MASGSLAGSAAEIATEPSSATAGNTSVAGAAGEQQEPVRAAMQTDTDARSYVAQVLENGDADADVVVDGIAQEMGLDRDEGTQLVPAVAQVQEGQAQELDLGSDVSTANVSQAHEGHGTAKVPSKKEAAAAKKLKKQEDKAAKV